MMKSRIPMTLMAWPPKRLAGSTPVGWRLRSTRHSRRAAEAAHHSKTRKGKP